MLQEFKKFIMRGNVFDMAIGVIVGGAFSKITSSLVADIIMPLIGMISGGIDFTTLSTTMHGISGNEVTLTYGIFIQTIIDFLLIAIACFVMVKVVSNLKKKEEAAPAAPPAPPEPTKEEVLLTEIRDLLKEQQSK